MIKSEGCGFPSLSFPVRDMGIKAVYISGGGDEWGWAKEGTDAGDLGYMECTGLGWDGDTGGVRDDTWKMLSIGGDMSSLGK